MDRTLRAWAKAYREGPPQYRFPSDPNAEFFPVDMDDAAAEIEKMRADMAEIWRITTDSRVRDIASAYLP